MTGASADEMYRDKFVFGLKSDTIRTELLKNILNQTTLVAEAKALESTQKTNQLIVDMSKETEERVNWTSYKNMKLK